MTDVTLLDGGMGQELIARASGAPTPLWSTQVMIDNPGLVAEVHRDFTAAGATVATTNTYAIIRDRLVGTPYEDRFADLHTMALAEARLSKPRRIGGAIGPLGASYRPDLHPSADAAAPLYAEIAQMLGPSCDLIICESVASVTHAEAVLRGAARAGRPVWLACTVRDDDGTRLRSGEPLSDVLPFAEAAADAVLINCARPEVVRDGLAVLAHQALPFGAYANGFEEISGGFLTDKPTVDALTARKDMTPEAYAAYAMDWVHAGATIVGGCCEVGPAHIAKIAECLRAEGHTIV
ncbi:MAG: homocysteine S-methyltransferase family protein [Pseudomonadota bacterium]